MPIHLTTYQNRQEAFRFEHAWEINDTEIEHLKYVFENYKKLTGNNIEEYSDTFLDKGCLKPLQEATTEAFQTPTSGLEEQNTIKKLLDFTQNAIKSNKGLAFIGE